MSQGSDSGAPARGLRFFYVDDSGAEDTGYVVFSWVEVAAQDWHAGLAAWLELRKRVYAEHHIPPAEELHATKFTAGRGEPSTDVSFNRSKRRRRAVAEQGLAAIGGCPQLAVGTVYRHTSARRQEYAVERQDVYHRLIAHLDTRLGTAGELGLVVMDGNGSDTSYYDAHRALKLDSRNVIEDPMFVPAHRSQWVQMADLAAWSAYQGLQRHHGKGFAWDWYATHLQPCDVNGGPLAL